MLRNFSPGKRQAEAGWDQAHIHQIGDVGFALGDGSGFIQYHRADGMGDFRASADLIKIPFSAPFPVPTIMAVGVARPSAQGQEMTNAEIPMERAKEKGSPMNSQTIIARTAMEITMGTNTPLTRSASLEMGALEELASSTKRMI